MIIVDRAITLHQPYASLMALGAKAIETRGRPTSFRGWVAIHAAKGRPDNFAELLADEAIEGALDEAGLDRDRLPFGRVLAVVNIVDCRSTETLNRIVTVAESRFGNYAPGRYGYLTYGVRRLREPFEARGYQSIPWKLERQITEEQLL
jgi:activating signal cointegrator 1